MMSKNKIGKNERVRVARAPTERLNVMVVGESGGGKTTACTTLLRGFDELKDHHYEIEVLQDASGKTLNIGRLGVVDTTTDPAQPSATHIYDSNGYGDSVNNQSDFDAIRNYIVERHRKYYSTPLHGRTADQHKEFDERIHCCLYFISPHRMKRIDEIFIESLADVVNIVPIVAKADTMTMEEREKFLQEVVARIAKIQERVRRKHDLRAIFQFDLQDAAVKFMKKRRIREDPDAHITQVKSNGKILNDSKGRSINELFPSKLSGESDDDDDDDDDDDLYECAKAASEEDHSAPAPAPAVSEVAQETNICSPMDDFGIESYQSASDLDQQEADLCKSNSLQSPPAVGVDAGSRNVNEGISRAKNIFAIISDPNLHRAYPWGTAEVERLDHSDFPLLKEYLFRIESIRSMIASTTRRSELLHQRETELEEEKRRVEEEELRRVEEEEIDRRRAEDEQGRLIEEEIRQRIEEGVQLRLEEMRRELLDDKDKELKQMEEQIRRLKELKKDEPQEQNTALAAVKERPGYLQMLDSAKYFVLFLLLVSLISYRSHLSQLIGLTD